MSRVALVVIFNHPHMANVDVLNGLYGDRFDSVIHLMPGYLGARPDVVGVVGNGQYFHAFIAQAYQHLASLDADQYVFIGDDLILNPRIHAGNVGEYFGLVGDGCFVPFLMPLWEMDRYLHLAHEAYTWRPDLPGYPGSRYLPSKDEAEQRFAAAGYPVRAVARSVVDLPWFVRSRSATDSRKVPSGRQLSAPLAKLNADPRLRRLMVGAYGSMVRPLQDRRPPVDLPYPLMGGYADIVVVARDHLARFSELCGAFSATNLFVELAVPTAMLLTTSDFVTEEDLPRRGLPLGDIAVVGERHWHRGPRRDFAVEYGGDFEAFLADFPDDLLYIHPVKLSTWQS